MRAYVITDTTGRIVAWIAAEAQEVKPQPDSEDTMSVTVVPESSQQQSVYEVELPDELVAIESPTELQEALDGYRVEVGSPTLVQRR